MAAEAIVSTILEQLDSIVGTDHGEMLTDLKTKFHDIQSFVKVVEIRQVKEEAVRDWLDKLKDTFYGMEDHLAIELQTRAKKTSNLLRKVCSYSSYKHFSCCEQVVSPFEIESLRTTVDAIAREKDELVRRFHLNKNTVVSKQKMSISSIRYLSELIHDRDQYKNELLDLLLGESHQGPIFPIISIVGMRGSGKTTLAQQVFNTNEVDTHFNKKIWMSVSDLSDEISITKEILRSLHVVAKNVDDLETLLRQIELSLEKTKFLFVLDDLCVTDPKSWKTLSNICTYGFQGSKILVTIRQQNKIRVIGTTSLASLGKLSNKECWSLFSQVACPRSTNEKYCDILEESSRKIRCNWKSLPLTLRILGGLLRLKTSTEEWVRILDSEIWGLENVEKGFCSSIFVSYYDLPTTLRRCFLCCAIFPKQYKLKKDTLIKLWMALGYLKVNGSEVMENTGEEYFQKLSLLSFFHDFERNEHNNKIISCKMPDVIYDFARFLAKNECCITEVNNPNQFQFEFSYNKVQHLKIIENSTPTLVSKNDKILCRLIKSGFSFKTETDLSKLLDQLTCLKTLDLSGCSFKKLPGKIKNLRCLRYLNLSHNKDIKKLPEALCELQSLRTLDISNCGNLQTLPHQIGNLINLMHLVNYGTPLSYVPKGIFETLTSLRTLSKFATSDEKDDHRASRLQDLANLNHLEGFLIITGLGNARDVEEVKNAKLIDKKNLVGLALRFDGLTHVDDEAIFESLEPPSNLEELMVQYYIGKTMSLGPLMSLQKLRVLKLSFCLEFEHLPALGELPHLESLSISNMKSVKSVGKEFLGKADDGTGTIFPKLRILQFEHMDEWKQWGEDITKLSCLVSLIIGHCHKLESLPDNILQTPTLKKLEIYNCSIISELYRKKTESPDWSEISHIPNIKIDGEQVRESKYN